MEFAKLLFLFFIERMREKNKRSTSWEDRQFHKIESGLTELETIIPESGFLYRRFLYNSGHSYCSDGSISVYAFRGIEN